MSGNSHNLGVEKDLSSWSAPGEHNCLIFGWALDKGCRRNNKHSERGMCTTTAAKASSRSSWASQKGPSNETQHDLRFA